MSVLTTAEFDSGYNKALCSFAELCERELTNEIYGMRRSCAAPRAERLWLYVYALNTWDNTDVDNNYLTEAQMLQILSKVQNHGI